MQPHLRFTRPVGPARRRSRRLHADRDDGHGRHRRRALEHRLSEPRRPGAARAPQRRAGRADAGAARPGALPRQQRAATASLADDRRAPTSLSGHYAHRRSSSSDADGYELLATAAGAARRATRAAATLRLALADAHAELRLGQRRDHGRTPPTSTARAGAGDGTPSARAASRWSSCSSAAAVGLVVVAAGTAASSRRISASSAARADRGAPDAGPARRRRARRRATCAAPATGPPRRRACAATTAARSLANPYAAIAPAQRPGRRVALSFSSDARRRSERRRQRAVRLSPAQRRDRAAARRRATGRRSPIRRRSSSPRSASSRASTKPSLATLLRRAVRGRQHDLPAAPAGAQLRDRVGRPLGRSMRCVTRELRSVVRVRNDVVVGSCEA